MKRNSVAVIAAICFGLLATTNVASAFEEAGNGVQAKSYGGKASAAPIAEDDDDESFFSGGSNPAVPSFKSPRASFAAVDVAAVCRAVLAEAAGNYNASFYEGCRKAVSLRPVRRAAR